MFRNWLVQSAQASYVVVGVLSWMLGLIGILTPLLPTTPFWIIAVWALSKGSPRFYAWLMRHPQLHALAAWRNEGAIPSSAKRIALGMLFVSWLMLLGVNLPLLGLIPVSIVLIIIATFIVTRPTPANEQPAVVDNILLYRDVPIYKELRAYSDPEVFRE